MDKDRVKNAFQQAEGSLREAAGKITGNPRVQGEGFVMRETAKTHNSMAGMKDALRDAAKRPIRS